MIQSPAVEKRFAELAHGKDTRRWCEVCAEEFRDIAMGSKVVNGCLRCWKSNDFVGMPPQRAANHGVKAASMLEPVAGGNVRRSVPAGGLQKRQTFPQQVDLQVAEERGTGSQDRPRPRRNSVQGPPVMGASLRDPERKPDPGLARAGSKSFGQRSLPALPVASPVLPPLQATVDEERSQQVFGKLVKPFVQHAMVRLLKELHATQLTYEQLFKKIDQNGDGELSRTEMQYMLRKLGITLTPVELDAVLRAFDSDGNGTIDFDEFYALLKMYEDRMPKPEPPRPRTPAATVLGFAVGDRVRGHIRLLPINQTAPGPDQGEQNADGTVVGPGNRDGTISVRFDAGNQCYSVLPIHIHKLGKPGDAPVERRGSFKNARRMTTF